MIYIDKATNQPLYEQIYSTIKQDILSGTMPKDQVLMGSRKLAQMLEVSRNTVDNAYGQLAAEGYIQAVKGVGFVVLELPKLELSEPVTADAEIGHAQVEDEAIPPLYDLTNQSTTNDLFPKNLWKKYTLECLELLDREEKLTSFQDKQGEMVLRQQLKTYLKQIRGVNCEEDQIIITCGIQQSLEYLCKVLPSEKNTVLVEEPGYSKAVQVFRHNGYSVATSPVDEQGLNSSKLPKDSKISGVYTTPSHQFPTGVTMPIGRRYELLDWARKNDSYIIEDDFDSEQRYFSKPIPSLQSIDREERVIYLGTFSKSLSPSLRMGYMVLPRKLLNTYLEKFQQYNSTVPLLNQYVVAKLIETGNYERHIRRLNNTFRKRLELFLKEFSVFDGKIRISSNGTGQYFLVEFPEHIDQADLIERALKEGVRVYSTMQFWQDKAECPPNKLFLGFSKIALADIPDCVDRLHRAWKKFL
ncbi:PLP-dependent aminotransferase family protein [Enterococcus sp. 669A]|uniref:PLP-dependent aminotransferase family protein n=1 Tax=Candidatus Enterococcus moelleringii TaxID=2815325 RepID=A0ABS3LEP3_9ENTE|nr:PLP-dependent aminotransferase family protein [Enterococcus sp. 669A]MBO1306844.1 PLP-dependent aminotransferase family protein [Enterococcus sp. 669A]